MELSKLNFGKIELVGLNCPYFLGIQEHGQKASFDLDDDSCDLFHAHSERTCLNIHKDKTIYISTTHYNYNNEEWEDEVFKDLTDDTEVKEVLDSWLQKHPLYRSHCFPYTVSTKKDIWGCDEIADSLDSLVKYLKNY